MNTIRVLLISDENWYAKYQVPTYVQLNFVTRLEEIPKTPFDLVFIEKRIRDKEVEILMKATKAHTLYLIEGVEQTSKMQYLFACKVGKILVREEIQNFLKFDAQNYFPNPYGEKFDFINLSIAHGFQGSVEWDGNYAVTLNGDYGEGLNQIVFWRNNIPIFMGQAIDFWLEYEKDPEVEIALSVTQFRQGTISDVQNKWLFSEEELKDIVTIDNQIATGPVFVSVLAKGKGRLKIIALHDRYSRRGHGMFLPGGERCVTSNREEIFYYFDPGDMKPPLNIYFSGYKTLQGFEGYYMMRKIGSPFLLIAEPRLHGGSFYMGSSEYEESLVSVIQKHMEILGFTNNQVVMSGMSMGTFGAMYYGCDIRPHAMILGKPLASIGDVAENERLLRPDGFPTSLDVLGYLAKGTDEKAVEQLNKRFWDKFDATNWGESKFVVSYMIEDDYDKNAYNMLISHLKADGVSVYGKGIHGRHNDATGAIVSWFKSQYEKIMHEDFSRKVE